MEFDDDPLFGPGIGSPEYREHHLSHPDPVVRERRRKVMDRYPHVGTDILVGEILELVDGGKPWEDAFLSRVAQMAEVRSVPRSVLALCAGKSFPGGGIVNLAEIAARIPEQWLPAPGSSDAVAFLDIAAAIGPVVPHGLQDEFQSLFGNSGGRWAAWRERLLDCISPAVADMGEEYGDEEYEDEHDPDYHPPRPTLYDGAEKAANVAVGFANQVVIPTLVRDLGMGYHDALEVGYEASKSMLIRGSSLEEFLGLTRYFEDDASSSFDSALYERIPDTELSEWSALIERTELGHGIHVVPVTSPHALLDEMRNGMNPDGSVGLGIGVGGIIQRCMKGNVYPLSLRDDRGTRLGAIIASYDYDVLPDGARFKMGDGSARSAKVRTPWPGIVISADLDGPKGKPLGDEALRAFKRLAAAISEGRVPVILPPPGEMIESGLELVEARRESRSTMLANPSFVEREGIDALAEYPVAARGAVEAAFEAWRPYLPAYLREASFDQMKSVAELAARDMDVLVLAGFEPLPKKP